MEYRSDGLFSRRKFVATSLALAGVSAFSTRAKASNGRLSQQLTIQQVIDRIIAEIPMDASNGTVDTVKAGNPQQPVKGIVTTMFATIDVIQKAAAIGCNFIIAHEPTFYNHQDDTTWLKDHEVFRFKMELLSKHAIVVWRFHDYLHAHKPDGIQRGVLEKMGWQEYQASSNPRVVNLPGSTLGEILLLVKNRLDIPTVRFIGDRKQMCKKVAVLPGAWGGRNQINVLNNDRPDLLIVGELQEWETSEYIRDARASGENTALIVLGHSVSEEPGMEWLVSWLQPKVPGVKITHVPSGNPFTFA